MVIVQGDVVWVELRPPLASEPGGRRPMVVLQTDRLNRSAISTVVAASITSQLKYARFSGNVRLAKGEAGLPRASVVNVTQIVTVDRSWIIDRLGTLGASRVVEIWDGVRMVLEPRLVSVR